MTVCVLRRTNFKQKREISFRHIVKPLNLLMAGVEGFRTLFSFLLGCCEWGWKPSTSLPLCHQHHRSRPLPHLCNCICMCESASVYFNYTTLPLPPLSVFGDGGDIWPLWSTTPQKPVSPFYYCSPWGPGTQSWSNAGSQELKLSLRRRSVCAPLRTPSLWTNEKTAGGGV